MSTDNQHKPNAGRGRRNAKRRRSSPAAKSQKNSVEKDNIQASTAEQQPTQAQSPESISTEAEPQLEKTDTLAVTPKQEETPVITDNAQAAADKQQPSQPVAENITTTETVVKAETSKSQDADQIAKSQTKPLINDKQGEKKKMSSTNTSSKGTANKANKTAETKPVVAQQTPQKSGSGFAGLIAFVALLTSAAAGYGVYTNWEVMKKEKDAATETIANLKQQLKSQIESSQAAIKTEVNQSQQAMQQEVIKKQDEIQNSLSTKSQELQTLAQKVETSADDKISTAEANLSKAQLELGKATHTIQETQKKQDSLQVSIDGLYSRLGNTSKEWAIAEADYLLKVANHRLQLEQDVTTAIQALTLADKRLASIDDPALTEVRNIIAQELISLQTLPVPDQSGIAMQLTQLQNKVDQLPLKAHSMPVSRNTKPFEASDAPHVKGWAAVPGAVMKTLKDLVVVRYNDKPIEPLLSPEQVNNIQETLKLKLEQARVVLFRGAQKEYDANMDLAIAWTKDNFNMDDVATKKFVDTLNYLKDKQVALKTPDISASIRSLHKVAKRMELKIPHMESNANNNDNSNNVAMK